MEERSKKGEGHSHYNCSLLPFFGYPSVFNLYLLCKFSDSSIFSLRFREFELSLEFEAGVAHCSVPAVGFAVMTGVMSGGWAVSRSGRHFFRSLNSGDTTSIDYVHQAFLYAFEKTQPRKKLKKPVQEKKTFYP